MKLKISETEVFYDDTGLQKRYLIEDEDGEYGYQHIWLTKEQLEQIKQWT